MSEQKANIKEFQETMIHFIKNLWWKHFENVYNFVLNACTMKECLPLFLSVLLFSSVLNLIK